MAGNHRSETANTSSSSKATTNDGTAMTPTESTPVSLSVNELRYRAE